MIGPYQFDDDTFYTMTDTGLLVNSDKLCYKIYDTVESNNLLLLDLLTLELAMLSSVKWKYNLMKDIVTYEKEVSSLKCLRFLDRHIEEIIIVAITTIMLFALFFQVIARFFLNAPLAWTEELAINLMPWLCYFGSSLAVREKAHLKVEIITNFLSEKGKIIFDIIGNASFFVFAAIISFYSFKLTVDIYHNGINTAVLQWPKWIMYAGIPLAFILTLYHVMLVTIDDFKILLNNGYKQKQQGGESQ